MIALALAFAFVMQSNPPNLDDLARRADAVYARGDYEAALPLYQQLAARGRATAMTRLGRMYEEGEGLTKDTGLAVVWYRRGAEAGDTAAMDQLGRLYMLGLGVEQDDGQAAGWYRKAAEKGDVGAMLSLGFFYESGRGVPQDNTQAIEWYLKAAELGDANAARMLRQLAKKIGVAPPTIHLKAPATPSGVTAPIAIRKAEPKYSEQARRQRRQGTVVLSIVIDETGRATQFKVLRPLGLGLDEKAIEAVKKWRFKPGMKDGKPVAVLATVEVNFRLL